MAIYLSELVDALSPFVTELLEKNGEFFPVAAVVTNDDSIEFVSAYSGNEQPPSQEVIDELKEALKTGWKESLYKAGVIFYDVLAPDPDTNIKSDAVAVLYESAEEPNSERHFFPYKLTNGEIEYGHGWVYNAEKEIFV